MKKIKLMFLAAKIEWNWLFIKKERMKGRILLNKGDSLSSTKLLRHNRLLSKYAVREMRAQNSFSRLLHSGHSEI